MGGSLDPDPDPTSPFYDPEDWRPALLMGGQACVFYGAAQVGKNVDFLVLADAENYDALRKALAHLDADAHRGSAHRSRASGAGARRAFPLHDPWA